MNAVSYYSPLPLEALRPPSHPAPGTQIKPSVKWDNFLKKGILRKCRSGAAAGVIAMVLASDKATLKSKHWGDTQSSSWMISRYQPQECVFLFPTNIKEFEFISVLRHFWASILRLSAVLCKWPSNVRLMGSELPSGTFWKVTHESGN